MYLLDDYINILENSKGFVQFVLLLFSNIIINATGFLPSAFITAVNLMVYGIIQGTILSFIGDVLGTQAGYHLYRMGVSKSNPRWKSNAFWRKMQNSYSLRLVFISIIFFRLLSFVPSGLVTAGAAVTSIGKWSFMLASTVGKVPSILIEVAIVNGFLHTFNLSLLSICIIFLCIIVSVCLFKRIIFSNSKE